jgi:hypothetical protein
VVEAVAHQRQQVQLAVVALVDTENLLLNLYLLVLPIQ